MVFLLILVSGSYYYHLYPAMQKQRLMQEALDEAHKAVVTKDHEKIKAFLQQFLSDQATIKLEISLKPIGGAGAEGTTTQDFDKAGFIAFIDNTLSSVNSYGYVADLKSFRLNPRTETAAIMFISNEWGEGLNYLAGMDSNMRMASVTVCNGEVSFDEDHVVLNSISCKSDLRSTYKPSPRNF